MVIDPNPWRTVLAAVILMLTATAGISVAIRGAVWAMHAIWRKVRRSRVQRELRLVPKRRAS